MYHVFLCKGLNFIAARVLVLLCFCPRWVMQESKHSKPTRRNAQSKKTGIKRTRAYDTLSLSYPLSCKYIFKYMYMYICIYVYVYVGIYTYGISPVFPEMDIQCRLFLPSFVVIFTIYVCWIVVTPPNSSMCWWFGFVGKPFFNQWFFDCFSNFWQCSTNFFHASAMKPPRRRSIAHTILGRAGTQPFYRIQSRPWMVFFEPCQIQT